MEKIILKQSPKEILIPGSADDGQMDVFSYGSEFEEDGKLGSLYIVGNVSHATDDGSYISNLIASLAKREYYSKEDAPIRDAFTGTLKKINEVVEEFFQNKNLKINIGIFAIAGENILISKIGKFKILLAREGKNIDILNNIDLFSKEHVQEKEFSNIVSGKIKSGDKILAFYPNKNLTSREKTVKANFLSLDPEKFTEKIQAIKEGKQDFGCAILAISLNEHKKIITAKPPRTVVPPVEAIREKEAEVSVTKPAPTLVSAVKEKSEKETHEKTAEVPPPIINPVPEPTIEIPKIIPAEFSLGKKKNPISLIGKALKPRNLNFNPRLMKMGGLVIAVLVVGFGLFASRNLFSSQETKEADRRINEINANIELAKTKLGENDLSSARNLLLSSLAQISSPTDEKTEKVKSEILSTLDSVDSSQDVSPSLVYEIPQEFGKGELISVKDETVFVFTTAGDSSKVLEISGGSIKNQNNFANNKGDLLAIGENSPLLVNLAEKSVAFISDGQISTHEFEVPALISFDVYEENLYALSASEILKLTDIKSGSAPTSWLINSSDFSSASLKIAVDGNIYTIDKSGGLTTYYKGQKTTQVNTSLVIDGNSLFITASEAKKIYIINKELGRIYVINKEGGSVEKVLKLGNSSPIVGASVSNQDVIYALTEDNKIWKVSF